MESEVADLARLSRLRWRIRGAWQWPTFGAFVIVDAALLDRLPPSGAGGDIAGAVLLAGFINLVTVALPAPLTGWLVRRRRPDLPRVVANDYAGTALILVVAMALAAAGLAHRPAVIAQHHAFQAQSDAVRSYIRLHGDAANRRNLDRADSLRLDDNLFRTCVPGTDPLHALCLFVDTSQTPPGLRLDPNPIPNSRYFGPRGVGRPG